MIDLNSLNIVVDNFSLIIGKNYDIKTLFAYYISTKQKSDRLVLEDEFVGNSYDNLKYLETLLFNNEKDSKDHIKKYAKMM